MVSLVYSKWAIDTRPPGERDRRYDATNILLSICFLKLFNNYLMRKLINMREIRHFSVKSRGQNKIMKENRGVSY